MLYIYSINTSIYNINLNVYIVYIIHTCITIYIYSNKSYIEYDKLYNICYTLNTH